ncbi:MAG TPA: hypothetical protein VFU22_29675 [Roseiflexaceae bacterium]|nr:hypothetical protein [Roseiflexaceae bacterium]
MLRIRRLLAAASLVVFSVSAQPVVTAQAQDQPPSAPTFRVFATREGLVGHRTANGHRIRPRDRFVALPHWGALSSKGGNEFQVRVTYRDRSVVLPVWDVGPWNTRDDYWSAKRRYGDLPVGMPMAHAAYHDRYNGGRDEFGRRIRHPNGIDIADGAFWDDLGMTGSDYVQVTFLWLGPDPGAAQAERAVAASPSLVVVEPDAVVADDGGEGYNAEAAIKWYDAPCGLNNRHAWTYGTLDPKLSENRARWSSRLAGGGFYEALAYIPACGRPATQSARYRVVAGGAPREVVVDQQAAAGTWVSLGTYHLESAEVAVELSDVTGDDGRAVRFDAVKWLPRADTAPPDARVSEAAKQADGSFLVRWSGADDLSGIAAFDVQVRALPDGGWTDWQQAATALQASFVPPGPGGYAFRARARDWVGHEQSWRDSDDVQIEVHP